MFQNVSAQLSSFHEDETAVEKAAILSLPVKVIEALVHHFGTPDLLSRAIIAKPSWPAQPRMRLGRSFGGQVQCYRRRPRSYRQ
jgi:hypothetical protein